MHPSWCYLQDSTSMHAQQIIKLLTQLFIFGLHFLRYQKKRLILVVLGCDGLQFGEFSLKRHCSHYQWHLEFQKVSFSSNIHNKLETNILTSLPAYARRAQFILRVIQGMDGITLFQQLLYNEAAVRNSWKIENLSPTNLGLYTRSLHHCIPLNSTIQLLYSH